MLLQVSWVRHRDIHLLTVGRYTYTSDQRFRAIHHPHSEDWILQIKYPQHRDSGIYECQISTTPHMSHFIYLNVIGEFLIFFYIMDLEGWELHYIFLENPIRIFNETTFLENP